MFFIVSKIGWFFLTPSNLLLTLLALGLVLVTIARTRRLGLPLAWCAVVLVGLFGYSPLSSWLMHPLEARFPLYVADAERPVAGIVVLGGAIAQDATIDLGQAVLNESGDRIVAAAVLARRHPEAPIVLSGGSAGLILEDRFTEADAMARVMVELGVAAERLVVEDRSQNTWQNALYSREAADPKPGETWLLVTSAWHMPRAVGVFRQAGFDITPYPTDFRTIGGNEESRGFRAISEGLQRLDVTMREYVGLLAYRLTGRTETLFPAPEGG